VDQGLHDCKIAINLSSVQLIQSDIVPRILQCLEDFKVPPRLLEIEITETILMENVRQAIESLERLHARGISIAIDDFGTGYSSLGYLKSLPIDSLKIDRVFIRDICTDDSDQKIVKTLITMAHSMGIKVVAEGVETREQFDLLSSYSADEIQGNLLSKAIAPAEIESLMPDLGKQFCNTGNVVQFRN
jgi:EAL domain-containing protein (putative c-di-GMP-specific phosphodiesterase class I)